jgi:hypothetical protein
MVSESSGMRSRNSRRGFSAVALTLGSTALIAMGAFAQAPKVGDPPQAKNMRLVGFNDLQARSAYQPIIQRQGDRYIAYIGHHGGTETVPKPFNPLPRQAEFNGTSIVDVTDPKQPRYLAHIPGQEGLFEQGGAQMVRACDGKSLPNADPNAVYLLRTFGRLAHEIWNVADPANPVLVTRIGGDYKDTHKSWWECDSGIGFLVSGLPSWRAPRMLEVYDLKNPSKPVKIRDFGLPGHQLGASGAVPSDLHGPISTGTQGNRLYLAYGPLNGGIFQIVDRDKLLHGPAEPTAENLRYPEISRMEMSPLHGAHTSFPLLGMPLAEFAKSRVGAVRDFVMIASEASLRTSGCQATHQMVWFADITVEAKPMMVSSFSVPEASGNYCDRAVRFGAHSSNESMAPVFHKKLAFIAYFAAGVRALDVRNPYQPKEVGYFIPAMTEATDKRCFKIDGQERCTTSIQSNNVETDDRGYIYVVDRANTGMHILELTGEARAIAGLQ